MQLLFEFFCQSHNVTPSYVGNLWDKLISDIASAPSSFVSYSLLGYLFDTLLTLS